MTLKGGLSVCIGVPTVQCVYMCCCFLCVCGLTVTGTVELAALLRVSLQSALEAMLPELREPGVAYVHLRRQVEVVVVEPGHVGRLELDGDPPRGLTLVAVCHIIPVCPAVTVEGREEVGGKTGVGEVGVEGRWEWEK